MITIRRLSLVHATPRVLTDVMGLMEQLRSKKSPGTLAQLRVVLRDSSTSCIAVYDGSRIIGIATLYSLQKIGKKIAHVEDVVVHSDYRGQGLGEKLMRAVIAEARKKKVQEVYLTSRPQRVAANKLYKKLGFKIKKTNPYALAL